MATLAAKKRTRTVLLKFMKELFGDIAVTTSDYDSSENKEEILITLKSHKELLEKKFEKFIEISETIGEQIEKDDEFEKDAMMVQEHELQFRKKLTFLKEFIDKEGIKKVNCSEKTVLKGAPVKLPKFVIKHFNGDPTEWQSFKESFEESVDKNETLSQIEKMNYLMGYLTGEAEKCLKGLRLSNENYKIAKDMLEKRFGNPQIIISSHVRKLLSFKVVQSVKNVKGLRELFDNIELEVRSLSSIGCDSTTYGTMLIPIIMDKIPEEIKLALSLEFGNNIWDINKLLEVFRKELEAREKFSINNSVEQTDEIFSGQALYNSGKSGKLTTSTKEEKNDQKTLLCIFCRRNHLSFKCDIITKPEARKDILVKENRCFVCMKTGHSAKQCRLSWKCRKCGGRHNNAICFNNKPDEKPNSEKKYERENSFNTHLNISKTTSVLLQTARGDVFSEKRTVNLRMLFDSGSQQTYISPKARDRLELKTMGTKKINIKTFGDRSEEKMLDEVQFAVKSKNNDFNVYIKALVSDICFPVEDQAIEFAQNKYDHLKDLSLADSNPGNLPLDIDILIGSGDYWNIIKTKQVRGNSGPVALQSTLGYILSGPIEGVTRRNTSHSNFTSSHYLRVATETKSEKFLTKENFEAVFPKRPESSMTEENRDILETFNKTTKFDGERYHVEFPFKENSEILGDNYETCEKRLKSLWQTFSKDQKLVNDYANIIEEQKELNIIEKVNTYYAVGQTHYLPHRAVKREEKKTTPIRIVFDASCKSRRGGPSLNDILFAGPTMTPLLRDVLLRLRAYNYVVSGDIEKAFLQIGIHDEHKDFVRFLWFENPRNLDFSTFENNKITEYRFNRLLFGINSSPFLLQATLRKHISDYDTEIVHKQQLIESLHIDDLTGGCNFLDEGKTFYERSHQLLKDGGFRLRKFRSNSKELENMIYEKFPEDRAFTNEPKILGIQWEKERDVFQFDFLNILEKFTLKPTKRNVLQAMASIFDPLGLLAPMTVNLKLLYQDICNEKYEWDDDLSEEFVQRWETFKAQMKEAEMFELSRKYCFLDVNDPIVNVQLHAFSDASQNIYASILYLRFQMKSNLVKLSLVSSRNRIISTKSKESKKMSIPRAELNGVLLMTELVSDTLNALQNVYCFDEVIYWTDSAVVHSWVISNKPLEKYVETRLKKIRLCINDSTNFKLIPSKMNPADIPTRGLKPTSLKTNLLWLKGPEFLLLESEKWPNLKNGDDFSNYVLKEERCTNDSCGSEYMPTSVEKSTSKEDKTTCINSVNVPGTDSEYNISSVMDINRFSSLKRLLRTTAWVLRFCNNMRNKLDDKKSKENKNTMLVLETEENVLVALEAEENALVALEAEENALVVLEAEENALVALEAEENALVVLETEENVFVALTAKEITEAKRMWIKDVQKKINITNQMKNQLNLFLEDGLWRCGGRIDNSELPYDTKNPWIIPRDNYYTELIVIESHNNVLHNGVRDTINEIRREYWITKPRTLVKRIIRSCSVCRRHEGLPYKYPTQGPLPTERVTEDFAFTYIGIDYAGPIFVKNIYVSNEEMHKAWITIITCATSRAVFLDLAPDYKGQSFINIFKRYISTHGAPKTVISDNGTNFTSKEVQQFASNRGINWKFNIPGAPWFGGFFEIIVKMTKRCLRKILGRSRINYNETLTILKEIQNVLNNRPITFLDTDDVIDPLTPNKLVYGRSIDMSNNKAGDNSDILEPNSMQLTNQFDNVQSILKQFWKLWSNEYLISLRERHKRTTRLDTREEPNVGDVVIIKEDNVKRIRWQLGKIIRLIRSADSKIRAAELIVNSNNNMIKLKRPINKLFPVEITSVYSPLEPEIKFISDDNVKKITAGGGVL